MLRSMEQGVKVVPRQAAVSVALAQAPRVVPLVSRELRVVPESPEQALRQVAPAQEAALERD